MTKPKARPGRPKAQILKKQVVSLRGSEEWREWLNGLADHRHMPASTLIDHALMEYAENHGFKKPMPKR